MGCASAHATTYYASPTGSGTTCSSEAPCSISYASNSKAVAGDKVIAKNGTYYSASSDRVLQITNTNGTAANPITIQAETPLGAIITGARGGTNYVTNYGIVIWANGANDVKGIVIDGFDIQYTNKDAIYIIGGEYPATTPTKDVWVKDVTIKNCHIHHIARVLADSTTDGYGRSGIMANYEVLRLTVDRNKFDNIGRLPMDGSAYNYGHDHGLYLQGFGHVITNNIFGPYHVAGWQIKVDGGCNVDNEWPAGTPTHTIRNNIFYGDYNPGPAAYGHITIYANTSTKGCDIHTTYLLRGHDILIENNISYQPPSYSLHNAFVRPYDHGYKGVVIRNNLTTAPNIYEFYNSYGSETITTENNITNHTGAIFTSVADPDNPTYTPDASFYGIDRGYPAALDHDYANNARPQGNGIDIGAYESSAPTPTVIITSPTSSDSYGTAASTVDLAGTATQSAGLTNVTWACSTCTPASGTATGTTSWTIDDIGLATGANVITVTANDSAPATGTDSITVTKSAGDVTAPTISTIDPSGVTNCTTTTTVSFSTNETATCKMDTTPAVYDSMSLTPTADGNNHSIGLSLNCNTSYLYYIRCKDTAGNTTEAVPVIFNTLVIPIGVRLGGITSLSGCNF